MPRTTSGIDDGVAEDRAWRIHSALTDWTGKVDAKATFCFALESAALVVIGNLTGEGRLFDTRQTYMQKWLFAIGVSLLVAGIFCAALVVIPRTNRAAARRNWKDNIIYFGHLRMWDSLTLEQELRGNSILSSLSTQLVAMSKIAWRKHIMVQRSLILGILGAVCLVACAYLLSAQ